MTLMSSEDNSPSISGGSVDGVDWKIQSERGSQTIRSVYQSFSTFGASKARIIENSENLRNSGEVDFCLRLIQEGWSIAMTLRSEVIQRDSQTPKRVFSIAQSRMHLFLSYWTGFEVLLGGILMWLQAAVHIVLTTVLLPINNCDPARCRRHPFFASPITVENGGGV